MMAYTRPVSGSFRTDAGTRISNLTCARPDGPGMIMDVCAADVPPAASKAIVASVVMATSRCGNDDTEALRF
jgi:hypothetical protein